MSLAEILERAATALPGDADAIRPANGDPVQLLQTLDPDAAGRVLAWLLSNEAAESVDLALTWADEEGGAAVLGAVDADALPKAGRKALRKALHRLRSRGVDVEPSKPREPVVARLPEVEPELERGYASALDPRGGRLVYMLESNPGGGARLYEVLCDEDRGIVDFQVYAAARGKIRSFLKQATDGAHFATVEAPIEALRAYVARIEAQHPPDRVLPPRFVEHRSHVALAGETPGDLVENAVEAKGDAEALARAAELVRKGTIGPWGPTEQAIAERVEGRLADAAKQPHGDEGWGEIAALLFCDEAAIAAVRERLRESAFVFWKQDQEDEARACIAGAEAFATTPVGENPLASAMVETLLSPAVTAMRARAEEAEADGSGASDADAEQEDRDE